MDDCVLELDASDYGVLSTYDDVRLVRGVEPRRSWGIKEKESALNATVQKVKSIFLDIFFKYVVAYMYCCKALVLKW